MDGNPACTTRSVAHGAKQLMFTAEDRSSLTAEDQSDLSHMVTKVRKSVSIAPLTEECLHANNTLLIAAVLRFLSRLQRQLGEGN